MKKIVILASGNGSNAENLISQFHASDKIRVVAILSNNMQAGVIERAKRCEVPCMAYNTFASREAGFLRKLIQSFEPDLVVLAGFLAKIPEDVIAAYPKAIVNIHPSLLPKFGGKGMYGDFVHRAVMASGERESGITIHWVNAQYDEGEIIAQATTEIAPDETPESLAAKIHALEFEWFPRIITKILYP
ncbi:MAG: phosphoribosylglycinamide formyltransferase [Flavobacteriaceae bacterium]|nr:phosphoribosylglycinamide formyltransferase [Flavobacteriaceae bacterium]